MTVITKSNNKSRNLTVFQLFEILQEEYIVCELRSKIYPQSIINKVGETICPADFWVKTMEKKKEKILDISKRNSIFSIFDDSRIRNMYIDRIVPSIGYPKFLYKDSCQELMQSKWDMHNYYAIKSEVLVLDDEGKTLIGTIIKVDFNKKNVEIDVKELGPKVFDIDTVTRIINF